MQAIFDMINAVCGKIQVVSDLFWDFPTNFDWYANIPVIGNFSLAIILLIGSGIYFSCYGCYLCRRPGCTFVDVGICIFRNGYSLYRSYIGSDIQRKKRR